ncbi:MAG: alpha/beta hydrolase [bacterium]|nr:alpha/beta hydrolase [bacterium]
MQKSAVHTNKSTIGRIILLRGVLRTLSATMPFAAVLLAQKLFVTPHRSRMPVRENEWASTSRREHIESEFGPLAAWVWGNGPRTAILLHGWAGRGLQLGAFVEPLVHAGFRVVAFDAPGHGESPGRTSSMPEIARSLATVSRHYGGASAILAHSLGATATILALAREDIQPQRIVAVASPARLGTIGTRFGEMTGFSPQVVKRMRERVCKRLSFDWDAHEPLRLAPSLNTPILVVHDRDDREIPWQEGEALVSALPTSMFLRTEKLGHRRILRDREVIDRATDFVVPTDRSVLVPEPIAPHISGAANVSRTPNPRVSERRIQ